MKSIGLAPGGKVRLCARMDAEQTGYLPLGSPGIVLQSKPHDDFGTIYQVRFRVHPKGLPPHVVDFWVRREWVKPRALARA